MLKRVECIPLVWGINCPALRMTIQGIEWTRSREYVLKSRNDAESRKG